MSDDFCPRQIIFTIPGQPSVQVTATEHDGAIDFTVEVVGGGTVGDLRGLFFNFNDAKMAGLSIQGDSAVTDQQIAMNNVIDLGNGDNLKGLVKDKFDIGVEFGKEGIGHGDDVQSSSFTLSSTSGNLTLDDIAGMQFGARVTSTGVTGGSRAGSEKIVTTAPHAPDAHDDSYAIFEDNGHDASSPTHTPTDFVMNVLSNDTDGDGDALTITEIHQQPDHGSFAISADGQSLIYTPEQDYSGTVSVEYCISDGHGGEDHATATIDIAAVADTPELSWTVAQGDTINQTIVTVTATQTDADGSEFIDSIAASGLPDGVTLTPMSVDPSSQPGQLTQSFLLTTPENTSEHFDLTFTATSQETSNGDTETGTTAVPINIDFASNTEAATFHATDQSIWDSGDSFQFTDDRFLGFDTGTFNENTGGDLYAEVDGHMRAGFQSTLEFNGGEIDATSNYDLTVDSTYNHTTDTLYLDTSAALSGSNFTTAGPEGSYTLAFVYDLLLHGSAGVDVSFGELGDLSKSIDFGTLSTSGSFNLLSLDSDSLGGSITLPSPLDSLSVDFAWPTVETSGSTSSSGASNNFLQLNLDVDQVISDIAFDGVDPFDPPSISAGPFFADPDLLNITASAGMNFLQDFLMTLGKVGGTLLFEDGSSQAFTFGDNLTIANASAIDAAGNHDGHVDFTFEVAPDATLENDTSLGFNVGGSISALSVELGYDIEIASDSTTLGPLYTAGVQVPVGSVSIYDNSFELHYASGDYLFHA